MNSLAERLANYSDFLPLCMDYSELLNLVMRKEKISIETARKKYGDFTYKQWQKVLEK